jgi:hypothetical protein
MAIVLPCSMTAHAYAAAGREVEVQRPGCPTCSKPMSFWGSYSRPLRLGIELRLVIRRARCSRCAISHALIPEFVAIGRLDGVEVIGGALEEMAGGTVTSTTALRAGIPLTTVRGWRRRFAARADLLARGMLAAAVGLGDLLPRLPEGVVRIALAAIEAVAAALCRRGVSGGRWSLANRVVGGHLLTTNANPPWMAA